MMFDKVAALVALTLSLANATPAKERHGGHAHGETNQPNIVLIRTQLPCVFAKADGGPVTDDQDKRTTMFREYLPKIYQHLVDEGVYYENFYAPVSLCCPSRVSLLRAQHAHNHNVTFVNAPYGGWTIFNEKGYVGHTMPDFLQQVGYDTYYVGKYM